MLKHIRPLIVPTTRLLQRRNTVADWAFYDVGALTPAEFKWLSKERAREGSILVVLPAGAADQIAIRKHADCQTMVDAPGDAVRHFAIAGVGSSDVGAAALARTLANHLNEPVGAIVAGYGMADILQEALGGWFYFGAANRARALLGRLRGEGNDYATGRISFVARCSNDTRTLIDLLEDDGRDIKTILGHSKGCLSIAYAFHRIQVLKGADALSAFKNIRIITAGAVVDLPPQLEQVQEYLGAIDWFGALNSILSNRYIRVPNAWHHLNPELPLHMDLRKVLRGRYGPAPG